MFIADTQAVPASGNVSRSAIPTRHRVAQPGKYRFLRNAEIRQLESQGCTAEDWSRISIDRASDLGRVRHVTFLGENRLGAFRGFRELPGGLRFPTGVTNATLQDCTLGDEVLVRNVRQGILGYDIADYVVISDISSLTVAGESTFGNGQEVHVLREDGSLPVTIFDRMSSNIAALLTTSRFEGRVHARLRQMIQEYVDQVRGNRGRIGSMALIMDCGRLSEVHVGPGAKVIGATRLSNATLGSNLEDPIEIGEGVIVEDSIIASGSHLRSGATVTRCFVGQGVRMGNQFSATDSLFFANAEAYHGEACSLLAGPYTVTHHKSTLLIASQTSFFNAGAGTNQCNHAYKTGPAHYGILERGCKTGGSSCVSWPANVGAFSTVLGKHRSGFDTRDFPFSFLVQNGGGTRLIPGLNLTRVGLWRDCRKWPDRDRRSGSGRLDLLHFESLSPWTVHRMLRARQLLDQLRNGADAEGTGWVEFAGTQIKRADLHRGWELYHRAIRRYLTGQIVERLDDLLAHGKRWDQVKSTGASGEDFAGWFDVGGCLCSGRQLTHLLEDLSARRIRDVGGLQSALREIFGDHEDEQWRWTWRTWLAEIGKSATEVTVDDLVRAVQEWHSGSTYLTKAVLRDANDDLALAEMWDADRRILSRLDGESSATIASPPLIATLQEELAAADRRAARLKHALLEESS